MNVHVHCSIQHRGEMWQKQVGALHTAQNHTCHNDVTKVIIAIFSLCMVQHCSEEKEGSLDLRQISDR